MILLYLLLHHHSIASMPKFSPSEFSGVDIIEKFQASTAALVDMDKQGAEILMIHQEKQLKIYRFKSRADRCGVSEAQYAANRGERQDS